MTDDLTALACPFCGSAAKWTHHRESYRHEDGVERVVRWQSSIHCTGCRLPHCSGFGQVEWMGGNALAHQHAMQLALEQWNRRAAPAAVPPGYALVPIEPTEAMCKVGGHVMSEWTDDSAPLRERTYALAFKDAYRAVLAAGDKP